MHISLKFEVGHRLSSPKPVFSSKPRVQAVVGEQGVRSGDAATTQDIDGKQETTLSELQEVEKNEVCTDAALSFKFIFTHLYTVQ